MTTWRSRLGVLAPLVLALFTTNSALPRPALFYHEHAGGDHTHVHDDDAGPADHHHHDDSEDDHHHGGTAAHHDHGAVDLHDDLAFEAADADDLGHWHTQNPFHRVVAASLVRLAAVLTAVAVEPDVRVNFPALPLPANRARAPPASPVC